MPTPTRLIADAKRAAKSLVRTRAGTDQPITYQQALDAVAQGAGRAHWSAFLKDPAPLKAAAPKPVENYDVTPNYSPTIHKLAAGRTVSEFDTEIDDLISHKIVTANENPDLPTGTTLGRLSDGRPLALAPGLSTLCIAPARAGKTSGLVVPHVLLADDQSLIIHDPKNEIRPQTASHRSTLGPVHVLDWSILANPDDPQSACINLLGPDMLPPPGSKRSWYIKEIAKALIPHVGPDRYWSDQARMLLASLIDLFSAIMEAQNLPADYIDGPMPQPSLPSIASSIEDYIGKVDGGSATAFAVLRSEFEPYLTGPVPLADNFHQFNTMDPKTYQAVLQIVRKALQPFSDPTVISRTMHSTFHPRDFRGVKSLRQSHKPVTLYLTTTKANLYAKDLGALVLTMLALHHNSHGPGETDFYDIRSGPLAVSYVLDEFAHLGSVPDVKQLTELGRIQKASLHIFAQPERQIINQYGHDWLVSLKDNIACELALQQYNPNGHGLHFDPGRHAAILSTSDVEHPAKLIHLQTLYPWEAQELKGRWTNPHQR